MTSKASEIPVKKANNQRVSTQHPFWVMVQKEISDHVRSWRFKILIAIIALTCIASIYTALTQLRGAVSSGANVNSFVFLRLFTVSGNTVPSFITFINFLGPLLGIGLGFDAINSERSNGTLSRLMSQPIYRDYVINAKFLGALIVIGAMFFSLGILVMGFGLIETGIPPSPEEFWRMILFLIISILYVAFWLNLSILFSIRLKQAATSALSSISIWIFFSFFYSMIIKILLSAIAPNQNASMGQVLGFAKLAHFLQLISPGQLFFEATQTMLLPSVNSLSLVQQQSQYAIPNTPLPLSQSLLIVWPQLTGLIAITMICFAISYVLFMRQEIRSR